MSGGERIIIGLSSANKILPLAEARAAGNKAGYII